MKRSLKWTAGLLSLALAPLGCNDTGATRTNQTTERTTTTTRSEPAPAQTRSTERVNLEARPGGATAADRTAANGRDAVDVDVTPGGGVDVDVQGEPLRDRIRERRAARNTNPPR